MQPLFSRLDIGVDRYSTTNHEMTASKDACLQFYHQKQFILMLKQLLRLMAFLDWLTNNATVAVFWVRFIFIAYV